MSNPWGRIGSWAEEAEQEEAVVAAVGASASYLSGDPEIFPSLKEAATTKSKKKKKPVAVSISEFNTGTYVGPGGGAGRKDASIVSKGLTTDELLRLPTGPKERSAEELEQSRLGGGFRSYGRSGPTLGRRGGEGDGNWGGGGGRGLNGGYDEDRRGPPRRDPDFDQPSRADEVDNWASVKKTTLAPSMADSRRREGFGSTGGGIGGGSRADEVDDWVTGKKPTQTRPSSFRSGFRDSESYSDNKGGPMRPRLVLDPPRGVQLPSVESAKRQSGVFGNARPREEVLAEKGIDWRNLDSDNEGGKISTTTSYISSRPSSAHSSQPGSPLPAVEREQKSRHKVNPFGDAKPREVLLQEKGKDYRQIDLELEHRSVDRPETEEERKLKDEINHLKVLMKEAELNTTENLVSGSANESPIHEQIAIKESQLEALILDLDNKIRFGQRSGERPGSGPGRVASFSEEASNESIMPYETKKMDFTDRPRSRGSDFWARSGSGKSSFASGRERGFFANWDTDRSKSRARW